jgi:hypothetical protein
MTSSGVTSLSVPSSFCVYKGWVAGGDSWGGGGGDCQRTLNHPLKKLNKADAQIVAHHPNNMFPRSEAFSCDHRGVAIDESDVCCRLHQVM